MKLQVTTKFRKRWCRRLLVVCLLNLAFVIGTHDPAAIVTAVVAVCI